MPPKEAMLELTGNVHVSSEFALLVVCNQKLADSKFNVPTVNQKRELTWPADLLLDCVVVYVQTGY